MLTQSSSFNLHARIPLAAPFTIRLNISVGTPSLFHFSLRNWCLVFFLAAIDEKYAEMRKKVAMKKVWLMTLKVRRMGELFGIYRGEVYGHGPAPP
jgi:hypothetical protein